MKKTLPFYKITDAQLKRLCSSKAFEEICFPNIPRFPYEEVVHQSKGDIIPFLKEKIAKKEISLINAAEYLILNGAAFFVPLGNTTFVITQPLELVYLLNNPHIHKKAARLKKNVPILDALIARHPDAILDFQRKFIELGIEKEKQEIIDSVSPALCVDVYSKKEIMERRSGTINNPQLDELLIRLLHQQPKRILKTTSELEEKINILKEEFPNFTVAIEKIYLDMIRNGCGEAGQVVKFSPILLRGEAGIGKTEFSTRLSALFDVKSHYIDLSLNSSSFSLTGMDSSYRDSKPGEIFNAIVHNENPNPILFFDEIDKTGKDESGQRSALDSFFSLLEETSAQKFGDSFAGIKIDASKASIIAAANDGYLPRPILDRFFVCNIPVPNKEQTIQISKSIWKRMVDKKLPVGHPFKDTLSESTLESLSSYRPRRIVKLLETAVSYAIIDGSNDVSSDHIKKASALQEEPVITKPTMGFF